MRIGAFARYGTAALAVIAVLAAAPGFAQEAEDEQPAEDEQAAEDELPAEDEQPVEEEQPAEGGSPVAFSYHGMLVGQDGEVLEDLPSETLEKYFGAPSEAEPEGEVEGRAAEPLLTTPYGLECLKEDVPIPPSFVSSDWTSLGRLPADRIFASKDKPRAEVLVYKPVDDSGNLLGLCVALPRGPENGSVEFLGVICQGKRTGKACFWDNVDRYAPPNRVTAASYQDVDISRFQDGSKLGENCTACHRGENVYVIHEDSILAKEPEMSTDVRDPAVTPYRPIGQAGWSNPQHANQPSNCSSCHDLPAFSPEYCSTVLLQSLGTTMPPSRAPDWKKQYKADLAQICRECPQKKRPSICPAP